MSKTLTITEDFNCFGDNVFTFLGEDYNFYQYNCSGGKDLIREIKKQTAPVFIARCIEMSNETLVSFEPALPILEEMLAINQEVASCLHPFDACGAGAEIAGQYGY
jgi:hypothetical protein